MELFFQAERMEHLGVLEDSDDPEEWRTHRGLARWIKWLLGEGKDKIIAEAEALRHPEPPADPAYMEYDSDGAPSGESVAT